MCQAVLTQPELARATLTVVNMCGVGCEVDRREVAAEVGAGEKATMAVVSGLDCLQELRKQLGAQLDGIDDVDDKWTKFRTV
jgi:hypothetical protein